MPVFEGIRNRFCVCFCSGLVTLCPDAVLDQIQFIIQKVKRRRETYLSQLEHNFDDDVPHEWLGKSNFPWRHLCG